MYFVVSNYLCCCMPLVPMHSKNATLWLDGLGLHYWYFLVPLEFHHLKTCCIVDCVFRCMEWEHCEAVRYLTTDGTCELISGYTELNPTVTPPDQTLWRKCHTLCKCTHASKETKTFWGEVGSAAL